jgi:predicted porin
MRIIIILTALSIFAFADYATVLKFYNTQQYQKAIDEAKTSFDAYSSPKLHLLWAKSAEALGHTGEAMSAYERVAMLDEADTESRVALVKIYKKSSRDDLAKKMSKELQNYQLTPAQRSSLDLLKGESIDSFKAKATLGLGYDSNINVSATGSDLDGYYQTTGISGEKSTLFSRLNGSLSYINELQERGGWYVRGDARLYYQNNSDAHYYDMLVGSLEAGLGYAGEGYTLYMPIGYDRVNYLDVDLLSQIRVAPRVNITLNQNYILNLNARYSTRGYSKDIYKGMGDTSSGVGAGLYYLFDKNYLYVTVNYADYSSSETIHNAYIDKSMLTLSFGVNYTLNSWLVARLDYRYRKGSYDETIAVNDPTETTDRADDYNQIELKLSHYFADNYELFVSDRYAKNSSNYVPAEYKKNILMFGISANY